MKDRPTRLAGSNYYFCKVSPATGVEGLERNLAAFWPSVFFTPHLHNPHTPENLNHVPPFFLVDLQVLFFLSSPCTPGQAEARYLR